MPEQRAKDFDGYARRFPKDVQQRLRSMRATIAAAAPGATETISYGMPAFALDGILVSFGAYAGHIGFYPGASGIASFKKDLSGYTSAKGSVQFPLDETLPLALVTRIVTYRVKERRLKRKA